MVKEFWHTKVPYRRIVTEDTYFLVCFNTNAQNGICSDFNDRITSIFYKIV